ncbi:MAG: hypothetical protein GY931_16025, partial [Maribacter sp.]|nr:hypothetical protein [Maribacter sp.]
MRTVDDFIKEESIDVVKNLAGELLNAYFVPLVQLGAGGSSATAPKSPEEARAAPKAETLVEHAAKIVVVGTGVKAVGVVAKTV